jgi:hypothetical protein
MGPNNTPEQNPPEKSQQQQAKEAAEQILAEVRLTYNQRTAEINNVQDENERFKLRAQLAKEASAALGEKLREQTAREAAEAGQPQRPEDIKEKAKEAKKIFLTVKELGDKEVDVVDKKSKFLVDKIVEKIKNGEITDRDAIDIERIMGKQLLEGVVFSPSDQLSSTEEGLRNLLQVNQHAATPLIGSVMTNPETYGTTEESLRQKLNLSRQESQQTSTPEQTQQTMEDMIDRGGDPRDGFEGEGHYYKTRFKKDQLRLISAFYDPERFVDYVESLSKGDDSGVENFFTKEQVAEKKHEIEQEIKDYYQRNNKTPLDGEELKEAVEKRWGIEVSKKMDWQVSDVVNQLFLELQQKSPHKFYEQIMQEDIFQGPSMVKNRLQSAINSLMTKIDTIASGDSELAKKIKKTKLYRHTVEPGYIEERGEGENKKIYPRQKPFTYEKSVDLTDFIRHIYTNIDVTLTKTEYLHNSRAIYKHPPGEKGFYGQLGDFAEQVKGNELDEIFLLPDGQYIMQAYQLYEKMLQEDFAQLDHRHRPDQLSNELERVNSKIEREVAERLHKLYPDLSSERLNNIRNSAVGIAEGIFLTEPEQSAYADPIDSEGKGMVASYSTNDAGSLNVFNPMHTILRWQGEHNINLAYFMPVDGEPGPWDHNKSMKYAAKYHDSLIVGKGRGTGKDALPKETFADAMMNIGEVGGPGQRKGWRMKYSLDGHFVFEKAKDDQGKEYTTNILDPLKSYRAMEAIGYEAIADFVITQVPGRYKDLLKTTNGPLADKRNEWFEYVYKRYFDQKKPLSEYLNELRGKGEARAIDIIEKTGQPSVANGSWEEQVTFETSQLFVENTLAHYVASRFPTKFMRIDKNSLNEKGVSRWESVWREFKAEGWKREDFDKVMKDMTMAEMLFRRQISEKIIENTKFDETWTLDRTDEIKDLPYQLNEEKIRELLSKNIREDKNKDRTFMKEEEINNVIKLYQHINKNLKEEGFLDGKAYKKIKEFPFTFGLEDTDISLMAFRATGPRMVARAIKDVASIESTVTPWILNMPMLMNEIAINGKHDFSPIIEYMRKAQKAITDIHGVDMTYKHIYQMAGFVINYFKKDAMAKPLFGIFRFGRKNSWAAEYAERSGAVWEFDARDIDRFAVALESSGLLKKSPYNLQKFENGEFAGGKWEDRWIKLPFMKKPIKFGKKRHIDYEFNSLKLRKEHGGTYKDMALDILWNLGPAFIAFLIWKYLQESLTDSGGKKK